MAELIPFTEQQIAEMRQMRRAGATLREIARHFHTSATTVLSYVRGIQPASDGQDVEYTSRDFLYDWLPALPDEGLPLPRWLATWMRERIEAQRRNSQSDGRGI
jgi:hypothetical protein